MLDSEQYGLEEELCPRSNDLINDSIQEYEVLSKDLKPAEMLKITRNLDVNSNLHIPIK